MPEHHEVPNPIHPSVLPSLHPAFVKLYNEHIANIPNKPIDLNSLRSNYSVQYSYATAAAPEASKTWDAKIPGYQGAEISVRVYEPASPGPWPVHIDFHGGGWGLGDLDTESHICKHIVSLAGVAVIDVAYRLVPEIPFPTGILDSFAALKYIVSPYGVEQFTINPTKISIGGVSAGGNIALVLAHLARDADTPLQLVAAGTPCVDDLSRYKTAKESPYKSMQEMEFAPTLNWAKLKWFDDLKSSSLSKEPEVRKKQMADVKWFADLMTCSEFQRSR